MARVPFNLPGVESWADLLRPAGWTFGIQVAGAGIGYGAHVLMGRWLGAGVYGAYVLAMGWAVLLSRFSGLGLPTAVLRLIPEYETKEEYGHLRGLLRGSRGLVLGVGVLAALGTTLLLTTTPLFSPGQLPPLLAGVWLGPLLALIGLETEILRAHRRVVWAYLPPRLLRPLLLMAGIWVVSASVLPATASSILGIVGGILACILTVQYAGTKRVVPSQLHSTPPTYPLRTWLRIAGPLFFVKGFVIVITKTDIFVIGALLNNDAVGIYSAAIQTARTITFVGAALDSIASSAVTRLYTQDDPVGLQSLVARLAHAYFWPTLVLALILAGASPFILGLFGPEFAAGRPALLILMVGLLANAATGCQDYLLMLTGHQRACAWIYGGAMLLNLVLNVIGVHFFGPSGAALATATSMVAWNASMYVLVRRRIGVDPTVFAALSSSH